MADLFDQNLKERLRQEAPLADRMRPETLADFVGQEQMVGRGKILRELIEKDKVPSIIFWGPPGTGKTTLARVIARLTNSAFVSFSAVTFGVGDLREIIKAAEERRKYKNQKTILFIDEIHRWSKAQQDALLPHVETGVVTLIGATTENPSFEVNSALLSRCRVFVLEQLQAEDIFKILKRTIKTLKLKAADSVLKYLAGCANGDARVALNALEAGLKMLEGQKTLSLTKELIKEALQKSAYLYDKGGEQHYNIISALHKSLRGSDANAALYWLARMLEAGEDPLYIARRLVRFAAEDVGLANSQALTQAVAGYQACAFIGLPECNVILAQVTIYLAKCKKSNALYEAYLSAQEDVKNSLDEPVPLHLRNAPTKLMKELGYGQDYKYSPKFDYQEQQDYLPKKFKNKKWLKE